MKIFALADRPPSKPVIELLRENPDVALVVLLGDLGPQELRGLESVTLPKFGVYGNHCSGRYFEELGVRNLHLEKAECGGLTFAGFEGCVKYKNGLFQYSQEEALALLPRLPQADVLLCHCPPRGVNDDPRDPSHTGFDALRAYVEKSAPKVLLHGHTYRDASFVDRFQSTRIEYVFGDRILEIP